MGMGVAGGAVGQGGMGGLGGGSSQSSAATATATSTTTTTNNINAGRGDVNMGIMFGGSTKPNWTLIGLAGCAALVLVFFALKRKGK